MADEHLNTVRVYLDDEEDPIVTYRPPVRFELDTNALDDGKHTLRIEAYDSKGIKGVRMIPFEVRNGPGIGVNGLQPDDIVEGKIPVLINAYGGATEENWEPARAETPAPVPTWAWVLLLLIVAWSMYYMVRQWNPPEEFANTPTYGKVESAEASSGPVSKPEAASKGATLFRTSCANCHQSNGEGLKGTFPPLAGDPVVTSDDPTRHIEIVLHGLQGKEIDGVKYSAAMPPWADQLSDEEISAIINHERSSWGNDAPTITPDDVAEVRNK